MPKRVVSSALALASAGFIAGAAFAHVPQTGQISRFQANLLRGSKPFRVKGAVVLPGKGRLSTTLAWYGPANYQLTITGIPKSFYALESGSQSWVLRRQDKACSLSADRILAGCPGPNFWAQLELSAQPDTTTRALVNAGFYADSDVTWLETDSRKPVDNDKRVALVLGSNGPKPVAALEIRGPHLSNDKPGEEYPLIQFDQTFLTPLLARYSSEGDVYTIRATADLDVRRDHSRFTHTLANRLDFSEGNKLVASFVREDKESLDKANAPKIEKSIAGISALTQSLSVEGQAFLNALLATH